MENLESMETYTGIAKKISKIQIVNFQSHEHSEIDVADGLTVIVGASDQGKSAIVRALKWLFLNQPRGSGFVRAKQKNCGVSVEYEDGTKIERIKLDNENIYNIHYPDGRTETFKNFGIEVPAEIKQVSGIKEIEVQGETFIPNIADQLEAPFVLSESSPLQAALIGKLAHTDIFDLAFKSLIKDKNALHKEEQSLTLQSAEREKQIQEYDLLEDFKTAVKKSEALMNEIDALTEKKAKLEQYRQEINALLKDKEEAEQIIQVTQKCDEAETLYFAAVEVFRNFKTLFTLLDEMQKAEDTISVSNFVLKITNRIEDVGEMLDKARKQNNVLSALVGLYEALNVEETRRIDAETVLEYTKTYPRLKELIIELEKQVEKKSELERLHSLRKQDARKLDEAKELLRNTEEAERAEELLRDCTNLTQKYMTLKNYNDQRKTVMDEISKQESNIQHYQKMLDKAVEETRKALRELKQCPICFNFIDEEVVEIVIENLTGRN